MPITRSTPTDEPADDTVPSSTPSTNSDGTLWLDGLLALCVVALAGLLGSVAIRNSDIWLHLATGRLISEGKYQFGVDPFCYTTEGVTWINPSWLFDWGLHWVFATYGGTGVVVMRAVMVVLIGLVMMSIRRPGSGWTWPAFGATLGLIAANPRLIAFHPGLSSYLDLSLLLLVLHSSCQFRRCWLLPVFVGLIQIHWVNHDGWFILGPIVVFLWLLGSLVEPRRENESTLTFLITLVVSVAACLVNPHFLKVFELPDEIVPSFFDESVRADLLFANYLLGPFEHGYLQRGPIAPSIAFLALLIIGVISFVLNTREQPWRRFLIWVALAVLATWRARLIPFFTIGATPLAMLNLQDVSARYSITKGSAALLGRVVTIVAVLAACFAAWPGWLASRFDDPGRVARVNPRLEPDKGLTKIGLQVKDYESSQQITNADRNFSPSLDVPNYLAWYTNTKSFLDTRWRLFAHVLPEFLKARDVLVKDVLIKLGDGRPANVLEVKKALNELKTDFDSHRVTYVVLNGQDRGEDVGAARAFWAVPDQWPMWGLAGRATMFGTDGKRELPRLNVARRAFEPQSAASRPAPPIEDSPPSTFWSRYLDPGAGRSVETETALTWLQFTHSAIQIQQRDTSAAQAWGAGSSAGLAATAAIGSSPLDPLPLLQLSARGITASRLLGRGDRDADVIAAALLGFRAARAAQIETPDDPIVYYALAESASRLPMPETLRQLRVATAWTQLQNRNAASKVLGRYYPDAELAAAHALIEFHLAGVQAGKITNRGHVDLGAVSMRDWLNAAPMARAGFSNDQEREQFVEARRKLLEQLEKDLKQRRDRYELQAAKQPAMVRFGMAVKFQLPGEAIDVIKRTLEAGGDVKLGPAEIAQYVDLLLRVGKAEEARRILMLPQFNPVTSIEPGYLQPQFRRLHIWAAAACGDVVRARDELQRFRSDLQAEYQRAVTQAATFWADSVLAFRTDWAPWLHVATFSQSFSSVVNSVGAVITQRTEYDIWSGLLALEEGDTRAAKRAFEDAKSNLPTGMIVPGQEYIDFYLTMLDRYER